MKHVTEHSTNIRKVVALYFMQMPLDQAVACLLDYCTG